MGHKCLMVWFEGYLMVYLTAIRTMKGVPNSLKNIWDDPRQNFISGNKTWSPIYNIFFLMCGIDLRLALCQRINKTTKLRYNTSESICHVGCRLHVILAICVNLILFAYLFALNNSLLMTFFNIVCLAISLIPISNNWFSYKLLK